MKLTNPKDGMEYNINCQIAGDTDVKLYLTKWGKWWKFVTWDLNDGSVASTGESFTTKAAAMMEAKHFAKTAWDFDESEIMI